jgi:WD40 repeat protein
MGVGSEEQPGQSRPLRVTGAAAARYRLRDRGSARPTDQAAAAEIGRGGIGRVLLAFDEDLGREVALKELLAEPRTEGAATDGTTTASESKRSADAAARLLREARVTGQLEHPNIVPVYELGCNAGGNLYYTMKMVRGRTLTAALAERRRLDDRLRLLGHFVDLCQAIAYAHSRGVIHRDIKPENVMLGEFGETVVLDWGLAKARGAEDIRGSKMEREIQLLQDAASGHTVDGTAIGTPAYMSPEQAEGRLDAIDERSDVWSLGAVLYEILTGRPPYTGATAYEVLKQALSQPVPPLTETCPQAPLELAAVCRRALQRDPDYRYQSARELAAEVEAYLTGGRVRAYTYSLGDMLRRAYTRHRMAFITAGIAVVLLLALGVWSYLRLVADRDRANRLRAAADTAREAARLRLADAHLEGARAARLRRDQLEARAKLRSALEVADSAAARVLWGQLQTDPLIWRRRLGAIVYDVAFAPTGGEVAAAGHDGSIYLIDAHTAQLRVLRGHRPWVASLDYAPGGRRLASAGSDQQVRIWRVADGRLLHVLAGHQAAIHDVAFHPGGRLLASCAQDRSLRLWDARSGALLQAVTEPAVIHWVLAFTPDGRRLWAGGRDGKLRGYRVAGDRLRDPIAVAQPTGGAAALAIDPAGRRLASGGNSNIVYLWDLTTLGPGAEPLRALAGHRDGIAELAFHPRRARLVSASYDHTVRIWNLASPDAAPAVLREHEEWMAGVAFSPDGTALATGAEDRLVALWRQPLSDARRSVRRGHGDVVTELAIAPDSRLLASGSADQSVRLWDLASGRQLAVLEGHGDDVQGLGFAADGTLRSADWTRRVYRWHRVENRNWRAEPRRLTGDADPNTSVEFGPEGRWAAAADYDRSIRLWNLHDGRERKLVGHGDLIRALDFGPAGRLLASASWDGSVRLWRVDNGRCRAVLRGHQGQVNNAVVADGGRRLYSSGWDRTVRRWDLEAGTGRVIHRSDARYETLAVSPDGAWLAGGTETGRIDLLALPSGELRRLTGHRDMVSNLAFDPAGRHLLSAGDDGTVRCWALPAARPCWRAPLLLTGAGPPRVLTHRGWEIPGGEACPPPRPQRRWLAAAARSLRASLAADSACLRLADGGFALWDRRTDQRHYRRRRTGIEQLLAVPGGCAVRFGGRVELHTAAASPRPLASAVTAMARVDDRLLLADDQGVGIFEPSGLDRDRLPVGVGATALTLLAAAGGRQLAIGYGDGTVEVAALADGGRGRNLSLDQVASCPVAALRPGPRGTLVIAYANGLVGLWDVRSGARLDAIRLHGPLAHTAMYGGRLHVVTELGDHLAWDLSSLDSGYCELLARVWRRVPVVWEAGRPVARPPPADHGCGRAAAGPAAR